MIKKIKVLYFISDVNKALSYEWIAQFIDKKRFDLSFILLNYQYSDLEKYLLDNQFEVYRIHNKDKRDWVKSIFKAYLLIKKIKPDVVHCHMLQANIIGLTASKLAGIKKRVYTRHHSSEHQIYFRKGILLDKLSNSLATHIIAISPIVQKILIDWENADERKVVLVPHGFLLYEFSNVDKGRLHLFKRKYLLEGKYPVIGVISRFTEWKGVQFIIPAFKKLLHLYPEGVLLLLNARGDFAGEIKKLLRAIPLNSYRLIEFENDIGAAYQSMDVFIHVPIDEHSEAFGQIYIESLSAGIPSIFTKSGIANDYHFNEQVAKIVDFKNSEQIVDAVQEILSNERRTKERVLAGMELAAHYNLIFHIESLEKLYS